MPRIFKGTETLLKLFVPRVDEGNLETLKIGLFTDDTNNAAEFYGDNMSIDGDTVYLKVNAWSFDKMNDGVLNYIAEIEIGEETIITERQSNYFLKTPNQYVPVGPDLSDFYTKEEIDEMLEDIEVDVDLTGYATEQWVEDKTYATEQYVNDAIANIDIPEGGSGGDSVVFEVEGDGPTIEQFNEAITLFQQGKRVVFKQGEMVCTVIGASDRYVQLLYGDTYTTYINTMSTSGGQVHGFKANHEISYNGKPFDEAYAIYNFPNLAMFGAPNNTKGLTHVIQYKNWYISATVNPDTLDVSCVLGDKLYIWNYANGEKDAKGHTIPRITDLSTQGGGSSEGGSDECIIIYEPNEETYTDEEKAHNGEMIKKIHNGTVKTAYLRYRNHSYDDAYIYVPLAFGWEVAGGYGYMTGVCKYWYYGSLHYDYFAIDMNESGYAYKFEVEPMETGSGGSGDADLSNYYTKEETDNLIANSSVMLEATDDGVLTYSQINGIRNNWANAYIDVYWQDNSTTMNKCVAITSLYLNDALGNNKNIHLEGICEGYLYTWDIKGSNTEGTLVRTPISAGGAAKAVVVETEKQTNNAYTDILVYSKLAIIQENIGNVYIRGKLNQDSTDINDAVVTNVAYHPLFDMLGMGDCKVTAMNANNIYTWTFTNKTTQASPTITPISSGGADLSNYYTKEEVDELITNSGGGSTPSTETDSGVYVLEFVDDIHEGSQDGAWITKPYEDSDRQNHNASVYQAWLEGKVKSIYYKQLSNTWYNEWEGAQYKLIPCMVNDTLYWDEDGDSYVRCMTVAALYRNNSDYDPTNIYSLSFPMKEDGSIIRDYYVSDYWMYSSEIGIGGVSNNGEGFQLDKIFASELYNEQYKVGLLNVYDNTGEVPTQERILAKLMVDGDFWGGDATLTVYGTLSNGSLIKWEFQVYSGEILNEYAIAQIIPMEVDLSSYYTKEEVDGLIANINLGDGATIENIVANEVANQLTDNFKTINGESILGEGDITIQSNVDLSNYYTKEETNNLIANSGGGSGNISELFYPTITSPTIVGEMTFNDEQLPHVDISESVYCNFKARKTQSKDLWVNNIHIGTNTDTIKIASPYYESTENMSDGAQKVYAEFTTEGIKENGKYLEEKYAGKGFITHPSNIGNFGYEDSAIVAYSSSHLEKEIVAKAWAESKALFVNLGSDVKKQIPVSIEAKYNSDSEITGYEVWGWYSKTQTITWVFGKDSTSVTPTIE